MEQYKVQLTDWQGPLDLLLQLIEQQEMDITKVSLANVAEQFIQYMNTKTIKPEETADFLVIAAKLLYIKSKALLPTLDLEEDDGIDLEKQLKMYKEYIDASKKMLKLLKMKNTSFSKDKYPEDILTQGFFPPKNINSQKMARVYDQIISRLKPFIILPKRVIEKTIKLSEKIQQIREIILKEACTSFNKLICNTKSKTEKIISFLAILELTKQQIIQVEQGELFSDIDLKKIKN
jgi:segregation and condensation protein A